jgi:hypothetical protein
MADGSAHGHREQLFHEGRLLAAVRLLDNWPSQIE